MNPLTMLDVLLADWAGPRVRRLVHALLALAFVVASAVLAADGDWKVALLTLGTALYAAVNKANTPATPLDEQEPDDGLTYEESGGLPFPDASAQG